MQRPAGAALGQGIVGLRRALQAGGRVLQHQGVQAGVAGIDLVQALLHQRYTGAGAGA